MTRDEIHDFLRQERKRQGLSMRKVGDRCGANVMTIMRREQGVYGTTTNALVEWAAALGFEVVIRKVLHEVEPWKIQAHHQDFLQARSYDDASEYRLSHERRRLLDATVSYLQEPAMEGSEGS